MEFLKMYALVDYIGNQLLIKEGEIVKIPFLDKKIGTKVTFDNVLLFDDGKNKKIGNPFIKSFSIKGIIDSHIKDSKVLVFKMKRRKGHQKKNGHTQKFTCVSIGKLAVKKATKAKAASTKSTTAKKTTKK